MTVFTSGVGTAYPWEHPSSPTVFSQVPVSVLAVLIVLQCCSISLNFTLLLSNIVLCPFSIGDCIVDTSLNYNF